MLHVSFTYIWVIAKANLGEYSLHGAYELSNYTYNPLTNRIYKPALPSDIVVYSLRT